MRCVIPPLDGDVPLAGASLGADFHADADAEVGGDESEEGRADRVVPEGVEHDCLP
jgi:hypothetical protein